MDRTMTSASRNDRILLKLECFILFPPFLFRTMAMVQFSRAIIP